MGVIRARCHMIDRGEPCDWVGFWRLDMQSATDDGTDHVIVAHDYDGVSSSLATRGGAAFGLEER